MYYSSLHEVEERIRTLTTTIRGFDGLRKVIEDLSFAKNMQYFGHIVAAGFELAELVLNNMKYWCPDGPEKYSKWEGMQANAYAIQSSVLLDLPDLQLQIYQRSVVIRLSHHLGKKY